MTRQKSAKERTKKIVLAAGVHINRPYLYEKKFFTNGLPVLEGTTFPLISKFFASGKVRLGRDAKLLGATTSRIDIRNLSYAIPLKRNQS
jgi:hypothetical protein